MQIKPRILIVKIGALGDLFFALPTLNYFKQAFPDCSIDWLVSSGLSEVLKPFDQITSVIPIDGQKIYGGNFLSKIWHSFRLRRQIQKYDAILLLHRHPAYLIPLLGKGKIFQMTRASGMDFFSTSVPIAPLTTHESLAIQKTAERLVTSFGQQPSSEWKINYPIQSSGQILIHLGGGSNAKTEFRLKRWPNISRLIQELLRTRSEKIVLVGSRDEQEEADKIEKEISNPLKLVNQVGKTNLPELVQQISTAKLLIGPDSGPLHIADQLGVPTLGLFGPTSPVSWGLIGPKSRTVSKSLTCQPCYRDDGHFPECHNNHRCMKEMTVEEVSSAASSLLRELD